MTNSPFTRRDFVAGALSTAAIASAQGTTWQTNLNQWRGIHPRLQFTAERLGQMRTSTDPILVELRRRLPEYIAEARKRQPPAYQVNGANDSQLYQRDLGEWMTFYAFSYLLTGDATLLEDAKRWALASCAYPAWGVGFNAGADLAAAHQITGLSNVYDWLFQILDDQTKATIRRTLIERAPAEFRSFQSGHNGTLELQNHKDVNASALAHAGFALFDDPEAGAQAVQWLDLARTKLIESDRIASSDGANHEGVTYADYGNEFLMRYWKMAEDLLGETPSGGYLRNTLWYRMYLSVPKRRWAVGAQMDIADSVRWTWDGPGSYVRRLGAMYRVPQAQLWADESALSTREIWITYWLHFVWLDPALPRARTAGLPTFRHFDKLGLVAARSDWSGDESVVVFKSGPPLGHDAPEAIRKRPGGQSGAGHVHPDANHFMIFSGLYRIRDDGYLRVKRTENHNTLLVNNKGQLGEGEQWFNNEPYTNLTAFARILTAETSQTVDYIAGEAAPAYAADQGVRKFTRHLVYLKPATLVVFDDIELDRALPMELRFHTDGAPQTSGTGIYTVPGGGGNLRVQVLTSDGVNVETGQSSVTNSDGGTFPLHSVRLKRTAMNWRQVTAFSWASLPAAPAEVSVEANASGYTIVSGERRVAFRWDRTGVRELTAVPVIRSSQSVLPAFGGNPELGYASNGFIEIYGENLAGRTRTWTGSDFTGSEAPRELDGTRVRVNGLDAYVYFISPTQINVNLPNDTAGAVEVQVFRNGVPSNIVVVNRASVAPALLTTPAFAAEGKQYVVAMFPESTAAGPYAGRPGLIDGVSFRSPKPGDRVVMYVLGAGPTEPGTSGGRVAPANARVSSPYELRIGDKAATVEFFGVTAGSLGLYQINAIVPDIAPGDQPVELTVNGIRTRQNLYLSAS